MLKKLLFAFTILAMVLTPGLALAARVSPMVIELAPIGRGSIGRIELTNPAQAELPVEVRVFRGVISEVGEVTLTPADEDFLVFPAQVVVPARSQQVFRVQYVGNSELTNSELYYVSVRQLPVQLDPSQNRLQIVMNFNVLLNVIPPGSRAQPAVESVRSTTRDNVPGVEVRIANQGTRYFNAGMASWSFTGQTADGAEVNFRRTPTEMARSVGVGVVAPGRSRLFFVPTEQPLAEGSVRVSIAP